MRRRELDRWWVTALLGLLAVPNVAAGLWGVIAPRHWFDHFPGRAPRLVAAHPPFNEHLATDAAAGLLAVGVAATIALVLRHRGVTLTAMATVFTFSAPHALFHLTHPSDLLRTGEQFVNDATLIGATLAAAVVGVVAWREPERGPVSYRRASSDRGDET